MKYLPILLILLVVLGCNQKPEVANTPVAQASPLPIKADDLIKAYKTNEVAADQKYKGKLLGVGGVVSDISETLGTLQADLKPISGEFELVTVKCVFDEKQRDSIAKLTTGKPAIFIGTNEGMTGGLYVSLNNCIAAPTP